jgi:hypothetical protein
MSFDDRPAYCETHSHAVGLGGEEIIEDAVDISWGETGATILDRNKYFIVAFELGRNSQPPFSIDNWLHRIDSVGNKVQDHLLQLHPIGAHKWQIFIQGSVNLNLGIPMLSLSDSKNLANELI